MNEKENKMNPSKSKIAIIRIRGGIGLKSGVKDTLDMLCLYRKNHCVIVNDTASILGMIKKIQSFVTWGFIDDETLKLLQDKKGKDKKFFALSPPRKGYGRKGIKMPFKLGGALGDRKDKINDLIQRMI